MDAVFRALADPTRRQLLDSLRRRDGQSLAQLCAPLALSRPAVAKHLAALEAAGLVAVQWRGREKRHFLNTAPLLGIQKRWLQNFESAEQRTAKAVDRALGR